ncbi:SOS-response transcriptional repressor LexA [Streptomyces sp. TE3672]
MTRPDALSSRQEAILATIRDWIVETGESPSVRQIGERFASSDGDSRKPDSAASSPGQSRRPRPRQNRIGNAAARCDARALPRVRHSNAWLW